MSNIIVVSQAGRILIWKCLVSPTARFNFDDFDWRPVKSSLKKPSLQVCPSNNLFYDNTYLRGHRRQILTASRTVKKTIYLLLVGETPAPPVESLRSGQELLVGGQRSSVARFLSCWAIHRSACVMRIFNSIFEGCYCSACLSVVAQRVPVSGYSHSI